MAQVQQAAAVPSLDFLGEKNLALSIQYFSHSIQCGNLNQLCVGTLHTVSNDYQSIHSTKGKWLEVFLTINKTF